MKRLATFRKIGIIAVAMMLAVIMLMAVFAPVTAADEGQNDASASIELEKKKELKLSKADLYLDGSITLRFFIKDAGSIGDSEYWMYYDTGIEVNIPEIVEENEETTIIDHISYIKYTDLRLDAEGNRVIEVKLDSTQQASRISVRPYIRALGAEETSGWRGKAITYSVADYYKAIKSSDHANDTVLIAALEAMLNYGAMAQTRYTYNEDNLANEGVYSNEKNQNPAHGMTTGEIDAKAADLRNQGDKNGSVYIVNFSATYKSRIDVNFDIQVNPEDGSTEKNKLLVWVQIGDGQKYKVKTDDIQQNGDYWRVTVPNIPAHRLDERIWIMAKYEGDTSIIECSVLNYIRQLLASDQIGDEDKAVAAGLYNYYLAISAYNPSRDEPLEGGAGEDVLDEQPEVCAHSETDWVVIKEATCVDGVQNQVCRACGETIATNVIESIGEHSTYTQTIEATCSEKAKIRTACYDCDYIDVKVDENSTTKPHRTYRVVTKAATCSEAGTYDEICSICKTTVGNGEIDKLACTYTVLVVENATCTETGYRVFKCKYCGTEDSENATEIATIPHHYSASTVIKEATCTEDGEAVFYCDYCGAEDQEHNVLPAYGHNPGTPVKENVIESTCAVPGSYDSVVYCLVCDEELSREIKYTSLKAHVMVEGEGHTDPTCTEPGYYVRSCKNCDYTEQGKEIPAKGHANKTIPAVSATCTDAGSTAGSKCLVCNFITKEPEVVAATGHKWDDGVLSTLGIKTYTCTVGCGGTKTETYTVISAESVEAAAGEEFTVVFRLVNNPGVWGIRFELPYNSEVFEFIGTNISNSDNVICDDEGGRIIFEKYHTEPEQDITDEILTLVEITFKVKESAETGEHTLRVEPDADNINNVAGELVSVIAVDCVVSVEGHTCVAGDPVKEIIVEATCEAGGSYDMVTYCTICNKELSRETTSVEATGHTWVDATCTTPKTCSVCGETEGEALGHTWVDAICIAPKTCSVCGETEGEATGICIPAGSNGEICKGCHKFLNVDDPATIFNYFIGGDALPNTSEANELSTSTSENGYRLYTRTAAGETTPSIAVSGETGQFMVIKYKATGSFNFEFFQSTEQAGAKSGWSFRHIPSVYGEWQYYIVDLTKALPAAAMVAVDGTYSIKGLRFDLQANEDAGDGSGTGTAEVAYIAYANSIDKLITGIKTLEGVENVDDKYCFCDTLIQVGTYIDKNTHAPVCQLCGTQGEAAAHTGGTHGVWNEELGFYAYECTVCGEKCDYGCTVGGEAENLFTNLTQWNLSRTVQDGFVKFTKNADAVFTATYFKINPNGVATGKYFVFRYRVNSAAATLFCLKYTSSGSIVAIDINNDGEWHTAVVTLGADFTDGDVRLMLYHSDGTARGWAAGDSLDIDWVYMYDSLDRIPAEFCQCPESLRAYTYDATSHTSVCTNCNKQFTSEAHTIDAVRSAWDGEKFVQICSVCKAPVGQETIANVVFDQTDLAGVSSQLTKETTDTGVKFTNPDNTDRNFTLFTGWSGFETGKYLFIKYRAEGATSVAAFSATDAASPVGTRNGGITLNNDGEWHFAIIDMTTIVTTYPAGADSKYYIQHFRMDVEGSEGAWIEVEYIGFTNNAEFTEAAINAAE